MHVVIAALHRPIKPTGVCRHAANLARCLAETEKVTKISLIIGAWQQHYFETAFALTSKKIKLLSVNIENSSLSRNLWFIWGLPKLANSLNPDIVHLSFPLPFIRSKFDTSVATTIHDLYPYECPDNFGFPQVWFNQLFLKQCINNSDGLACVSKVTSDKLKLYFPNLKPNQVVKVIYNYVDFNQLQAKPLKQLPEDSLFWLTVAQHRQNKNLDLLIKAFDRLLNCQTIDSKTKLVIVGTSGPETDNIHSLINILSLENKVILLAAIEDRQLCWLYQNCQIFIVASSTEGFCLPLAEALHFSQRIICSSIPIFQEVGNSRCTYFSLNDDPVSNLCQAVIDSTGNDSGLPNYENETKRFNKSNIAQQYLHLYFQAKSVH